MPTLFDDQPSGEPAGTARADGRTPLAERMRPRTLDEVVGQEDVVGEGGFLRRAIGRDQVPSLVFWGPPGSGKTTLARIIAVETSARFVPFSAVTSGIKEVKQVMEEAVRLRGSTGQQSLLFVDEIHRFNRAQQDAFLPYVERGDVVLIGATTENPSFEINSALLSRCRVIVLEPLAPAELVGLLEGAVADAERGLGEHPLAVDEEAFGAIAGLASGDARRALNLLEATVHDRLEEAGATPDEPLGIDRSAVERVARRKTLVYDKAGEEHFNLISALHKSLRESHPDAAVYWLARMLAGGEDPHYVARRMVRFASEDVGLADPELLGRTLAAWDAYHRLGSPEGELALAQAAVDLALAPKSDGAYRAWKEARRTVEERPADPVPKVIRNAPTRLMAELGHGRGYVYAHDTEEGVGGIDCLPESLVGSRFYRPSGRGRETELAERLERFEELRRRARAHTGAGEGEEEDEP